MEKPTVCEKCGKPSKADPTKLLCKICACGIGEADDDSDDADADSLVPRKSQPPQMKMEYSASRDPSKLGEGQHAEAGGFKVGDKEHEEKIKATLNWW